MEQQQLRQGILKGGTMGGTTSSGGLGTTSKFFGGMTAMGTHNAAEARTCFRLSDTTLKGTIGLREAETALLQMQLEVSPDDVADMYTRRSGGIVLEEPKVDLDTFCDMVMELRMPADQLRSPVRSTQNCFDSPSKKLPQDPHKDECALFPESVKKLLGEVMRLDSPLELRGLLESVKAVPMRNRSIVRYPTTKSPIILFSSFSSSTRHKANRHCMLQREHAGETSPQNATYGCMPPEVGRSLS